MLVTSLIANSPPVTWLFLSTRLFIGLCAIFLSSLLGCGESQTHVTVTSDEAELRELLGVPEHFVIPAIPEFNKPTAAKIDLGRHLFYDTRLSLNETMSCASCHEQARAFADAEVTPIGATGAQLVRNSQGLGNAMYHATLTWSNDVFTNLEEQLRVPVTADNPIELGVTSANADSILARFEEDPVYLSKFAAAFPDSGASVTVNKILHALASFCRTLITGNSPYDKYILGDSGALTEQQTRGLALFNGEKFECFHCHGGINFSTSYRDNNSNPGTQTTPFFNNGLYNVDGEGGYPLQDQGLFDLTQRPNERGLFRPQSLRNVALTAPYMHDGSIDTLMAVIEHYARGGTLIESGIYAGDERLSPLKSGFIIGFDATLEEKQAVVAFLESLTDNAFISNPKLSDPFK